MALSEIEPKQNCVVQTSNAKYSNLVICDVSDLKKANFQISIVQFVAKSLHIKR